MDFATENKSTNSTLKNSFDFGRALCGGTMCNRIDEIDQSSQFAKRAHAIQWFDRTRVISSLDVIVVLIWTMIIHNT